MNFDFPDVEIGFWLVSTAAGKAFYIGFKIEGMYNEVAGINDRGLFGAGQALVADYEIL
jgi:hypothetical protein